MMKKILTWFLLIFTMLLVGCTEEDKITLPDLTGKSRDEITETLEKVLLKKNLGVRPHQIMLRQD